MRVDQIAQDVGVSVDELLEILGDIEVQVEGAESVLTDEQIAQVCDELGYGSIDEARADNQVEVVEAVAEVEAAEAESTEAETESQEQVIELKKPKVVVKDFAEMLDLKPNMLIAELMRMNVFASINAEIDLNVAKQIGEKYGFTVRKEEKKKAVPTAVQAGKAAINAPEKKWLMRQSRC